MQRPELCLFVCWCRVVYMTSTEAHLHPCSTMQTCWHQQVCLWHQQVLQVLRVAVESYLPFRHALHRREGARTAACGSGGGCSSS
jgi:hypothetical protein